MYNCQHCSELLLDYLYGLLEEDEANQIRIHLDECPACRQELEQARKSQNLFASAALIYKTVPPFVAPAMEGTGEVPPMVATSGETVDQNVDTVAAERKPVRVLSLRRRAMPWLAAAAAILVAVGISAGLYQRELASREDAVAKARKEVRDIDASFARLAENFTKETAELPQRVQDQQLYFRVSGSKVYQPGTENIVRFETGSASGKPVSASVSVQCRDEKSKKTIFARKVKSTDGDAVVKLPGNLPVKKDSRLHVEIAAKSLHGEAMLEESLDIARPTYITHVSTNKPIYNVGELLFFRTLTLERFQLQPPGQSLEVRYALVNPQGKRVKQLLVRTHPNGVGGGEFALTEDLSEGEYTLLVEEVAAEKTKSHVFQPQAFRFFLRRQESPGLALDRSQYFQGDVIRGNFSAPRLRSGKARPNEPLTVTLRANNARGAENKTKSLASRPIQMRTDATGNAQFALPVPAKTPPGKADVEIQLHDGLKDEKITQTVPVLPRWKVDFFPEGGTLVAGVSNRVYCRVATPPHEKSAIRAELLTAENKALGRVELKETSSEADIRLFTGSFLVKPDAKQQYKLRILAGNHPKIESPMPPAQADGVALQVDNPVASEASAIKFRLQTRKTPEDLLVVASCRGHVVDQQLVHTEKQQTDVKLKCPKGVRGVIRLTVFRPKHQLIPVAERLLYRRPAERLVFDVQANRKNFNYRPGEKARLNVQTKSETGKSIPAWTAINVVDATAYDVKPNPARSLPDFFFLNGTVQHPGDLDNAEIVLDDRSDNKEALDRFLAIAGWREFVKMKPEMGEHAPELLAELSKSRRLRKSTVQIPSLFSKDNAFQIHRSYEEQLRKELVASRQNMLAQRNVLEEKRATALRDERAAVLALSDIEELPQTWLRMGLGVLVLVLLGIGVLLFLAGFWRIVRGGKAATPLFAAAFAALLICLGIYSGTGSLRTTIADDPTNTDRNEPLAQATLPPAPIEWEHLRLPVFQNRPANSLPADLFAQGKTTKEQEKQKRKRPEPQQGGRQTTDTTAPRSYVLVNQNPAKSQLLQNAQNQLGWQKPSPRFLQAKQLQEQMTRLLKLTDLQRRKGGSAKGSASNSSSAPPKAGNKKATGGPAANAGKSKTPTPAPGGFGSPVPPSTPPLPSGFGGGLPGYRRGANDKHDNNSAQSYAYYARRFINQNSMKEMAAPGTLLWSPNLTLTNGNGQVSFDLPYQNGTYRIFLQGHTASGRLGYREQTLKVMTGK